MVCNWDAEIDSAAMQGKRILTIIDIYRFLWVICLIGFSTRFSYLFFSTYLEKDSHEIGLSHAQSEWCCWLTGAYYFSLSTRCAYPVQQWSRCLR
jgi:hypothetical protein